MSFNVGDREADPLRVFSANRAFDDMFASEVSRGMRAMGYEPGLKHWAISGLGTISGLALFIIGCVGAAGAFPGASIGWVTVGLSGGSCALSLALGNFQKRKCELILQAALFATLITVGALGGAGVLSATQVGWGIVGLSLCSIPFYCIVGCQKLRQATQATPRYEAPYI